MDENSTTSDAAPLFAGEAWFDPIEAGLRERVRGFIEGLIGQELTEALGRRRHEPGGGAGHRHGKRERRLTGSFGTGGRAGPGGGGEAPGGGLRGRPAAAGGPG